MNDKTFRKHLADLAHGHHHPEEHDWASESRVRAATARPARGAPKPKKKATVRNTRPKRSR